MNIALFVYVRIRTGSGDSKRSAKRPAVAAAAIAFGHKAAIGNFFPAVRFGFRIRVGDYKMRRFGTGKVLFGFRFF